MLINLSLSLPVPRHRVGRNCSSDFVNERDAEISKLIFEIIRKRFGCDCVVDEDGQVASIITDGDLR